MMSDSPAPPPPDPDLQAEGWERRSLADPERAKEMAELYETAGFEVRIVPLAPMDFAPSCGTCPETVSKSYVVIYTRKEGRTPTNPLESEPSADSFEV